MDLRIDEHELEKLTKLLVRLNIDSDIIRYLCNVHYLSELNKVQYNFLLYILTLK